MLNDALKLASQGIAVFPLSPGTKVPLSNLDLGVRKDLGEKGGWHVASTDPDQIRKWWLKFPKANVAIAVGNHPNAKVRVVGVDLDANHGATEEMLKKFPTTVTVKTRNGWHLYYTCPAAGVPNHVIFESPNPEDKEAAAYLRSDGYYFVGPGSIVSFDKVQLTPWEYRYYAIHGVEFSFGIIDPQPLPEFCLGKPSTASPQTSAVPSAVGSAAAAVVGAPVTSQPSPGRGGYGFNTRHDMYKRTAISMRRRGCEPEHILRELHKRNVKDCVPPKTIADKVDQELENLVKWTLENVQPIAAHIGRQNEAEEYIIPLGHLEADYYYTSSYNRQIVTLSRTNHSSSGLLDLAPLKYWQKIYPSTNGQGAKWLDAQSDLMEVCRDMGIFDPRNMRGVGCWREDGKLVVHLGDRLYLDGQEHDLNYFAGKNIYALGPSKKSIASNPLEKEECKSLIEAANAFTWSNKTSGTLLAGALAIYRLGGALSWRPGVWITGPAKAGKTTVVRDLVKPLGGEFCVHVQGATTEAGIRQDLYCDSKSILFDESETGDKRSGSRMKTVLELIRQASSDTGGRILKGTSDGKGHKFNISSMFMLASIRVNLTEEADLSRFTVLELTRPEKGDEGYRNLLRKLDPITEEYGDRLFARMVRLYPVLMENREIFETLIREAADGRTAQQYGILLAGYCLLCSDTVVPLEVAKSLVAKLPVLEGLIVDSDASDEMECLDHLGQAIIHVKVNNETDQIPVARALQLAQGSSDFAAAIRGYGLDVEGPDLYIASNHLQLNKIYRDTKWGDLYHRSLHRLPAASGERRRFEMRRVRCVKVPLATMLADS